MMFLTLKSVLSKSWSFLRRYGWIVFIAFGLIIAAVMSMGRDKKLVSDLWRAIRRERELHREHVDGLDKLHDEELAARERAARVALEAIKAAEEQFHERNEELDRQKKKQIEKLVKNHVDDPEALSRQLAEQFGFTWVPS